MSIKHTATLPDGTEAKRTSKSRTYVACIAVGPTPKAAVIAGLAAEQARYREHLITYAKVAEYLENGGRLEVVTFPFVGTMVSHRVMAVDLPLAELGSAYSPNRAEQRHGHPEVGFPRETIADRAAMLQRQVEYRDNAAEHIEHLEHRIAEVTAGPELVGNWHADSWAGRPDLAAKAAEQARKHNTGREVRILEVQRTGSAS